ncbi:MAG TPA: MoaD/ThiS family protein [Nitrospiraceae bacterium]|jgi:molybdopterin synthase sulfur carrier subunit
MVTVLLFGILLRDAVGETEVKLEAANPTTVRKLVEANPERLGAVIPFLEKSEVLITVNKKVGTADSAVKDGDVIKLTHQHNPVFEGARWHNP